jgi:hypothetical protein
MPDEEIITVVQNEGDSFAVDHSGGLALYGHKQQPALQHQFGGQVVHTTDPRQPLVHMICWDETDTCKVEVSGRVILAGDEKAPVQVRMAHHFENDHHQTHHVEPLDHSLKVNTGLAEPIHHAIQMRTPLQLRFCNPWHVASDYIMDINLGRDRHVTIRLTGATVCTPQPCKDDEPCPPPAGQPTHP